MTIEIKYYKNEYDIDTTTEKYETFKDIFNLPDDRIDTITHMDVSKFKFGNYDSDDILIPPNLEEFNCTGCNLSKLPDFPNTLKTLYCGANNLSWLPENLPESLEGIWCSENKMVHLYEEYESVEWNYSLPNLKTFCCQYNPLTYIPCMPNSLVYVCCKNCAIESMGDLSSSLNWLDCSNNKLTYLPDLPEHLKDLYCYVNNIGEIEKLPPNLSRLECNVNRLVELPTLPDKLYLLNCNGNYIRELPELPNKLIFLSCYRNQLNSLPDLPLSLQEAYVSNNNISELPDISNNRKLLLFTYKNNPIYNVLDIKVSCTNRKPMVKRRVFEGIELSYENAKKKRNI